MTKDKDAFYFSHDYNAIQDPKIMILLSECGLAGVGMYWVIIEILHQQPCGSITQEAFSNYVKFYCHFQNQGEHLLNKIEQVLISSKLLYIKNGKMFSERVLRNKKHREEISEKRSFAGKKSAQIRLKSTSVQQKSTSVQHTKGKERKGKEIKEEVLKTKHLEFVLLTPEEYDKLVAQFGAQGVAERIARLNDYIGSKGVKYKNHYYTILNWARKDIQGAGSNLTKQQRSNLQGLNKLMEDIDNDKPIVSARICGPDSSISGSTIQ